MEDRATIIARAAQCLADDPTFVLLPGPQQFAEAEAVLSREKFADLRDPELVPDVLMAVLETRPSPAPVIPPRAHIPVGEPYEEPAAKPPLLAPDEPVSPVTRALPRPTLTESEARELVAEEPPVFTPPPSTNPRPHAFKAKAPRPVNDMPLLKLYKEATGASDSVVAHVVMIPRSTVQAICAGRVHETLDARQRHALRQSLEAQKAKIDNAIAAI